MKISSDKEYKFPGIDMLSAKINKTNYLNQMIAVYPRFCFSNLGVGNTSFTCFTNKLSIMKDIMS